MNHRVGRRLVDLPRVDLQLGDRLPVGHLRVDPLQEDRRLVDRLRHHHLGHHHLELHAGTCDQPILFRYL